MLGPDEADVSLTIYYTNKNLNFRFNRLDSTNKKINCDTTFAVECFTKF